MHDRSVEMNSLFRFADYEEYMINLTHMCPEWRTRVPQKIPFALWNYTAKCVEVKSGVVMCLSIEKMDSFISPWPSQISAIGLTGTPPKFKSIQREIELGVPLEPIHIVRIRREIADKTSQKIYGVSHIPEHICIVDGRHRYAHFLFLKRRTICVCVLPRQAKWFSQFIDEGTEGDSIIVETLAGKS